MDGHADTQSNRQSKRQYIAIDLKSFYASVECVERDLDPLTTNLVVADVSRTEKTICLAVSPSLKAYGIPGRARLFEVVQAVERVNAQRRMLAPGHTLEGKSVSSITLKEHPEMELDYIAAPPRMSLYMKYSTEIYKVYLKYIAPEDIHIYSCDEVFMDVTAYLGTYKMSAHELAMKMIREVLDTTGITATAGIGTNLFLCKIAMDIEAKHIPADKDGVRIAELDEMSYRKKLWSHTPITDFWRVGAGTARRLYGLGLYTMGDVARYSETHEDKLYKTFGVNAELLIDHAWGWEPCLIEHIKAYRPSENSLSNGQVLMRPYNYEEGKIIVREMADHLALDLMSKGLVTDQIVLTIGYEHLADKSGRPADPDRDYKGDISMDWYGRIIPKHAHGTSNLCRQTAAASLVIAAALEVYERTVDSSLMIRRINITACHVIQEKYANNEPPEFEQLSFFTDQDEKERLRKEEDEMLEKERSIQLAEIKIKEKYGNNAILKGTSFLESATGRERNRQIGGHRA